MAAGVIPTNHDIVIMMKESMTEDIAVIVEVEEAIEKGDIQIVVDHVADIMKISIDLTKIGYTATIIPRALIMDTKITHMDMIVIDQHRGTESTDQMITVNIIATIITNYLHQNNQPKIKMFKKNK